MDKGFFRYESYCRFKRKYKQCANRHGQLVHPLINEPLLSVETAFIDQLIILACLQELKLNLHRMQQSLARANENAQYLKPSQMTRLERSLASGRIAALMKDSTQPVASFLIDCSRTVHHFIQGLEDAITLPFHSLSALRTIARFCWDIFAATQAREVDEGEFQTYLQIGQDIHSFARSQEFLKPLASSFAQVLGRFQSNWALTTGLSMQRIWDSWRPITCIDHDQLTCLLDLEEVVSDFTAAALQTRLDLAQLSWVRKSLIDAQNSVLRNGADGNSLVPVDILKQQVRELASAIDLYDPSQRPHFSSVFETLCQYHDLPTIWSQNRYMDSEILNGTLPLLAGRPAHPPDASDLGSRIPHLLQKLSLYTGSESLPNVASPWSGSFCLALLEKLAHVGDISLGRLDFLETEQHTLAQAVALSSYEIGLDQAGLLLRAFSAVCLEIIELHRDFCRPDHFELAMHVLRTVEGKGWYDGLPVTQLLTSESLPSDHYFKNFVDGLSKCLQSPTREASSERKLYEVGRAFIELAVICLRLFVPDKPCDPSLGLVIQRRRHTQHVSELTARAEAIRTFEVEFSGQPVNLRHRLIQKELEELGSEPPAPPVIRPGKSQLTQLQGEFFNLINSVLNRRPEEYGPSEFQKYGGLLRDNIQRICQRLRSNFRSYDDITILATRFLQMLDLGISLSLSTVSSSLDVTSVQAVSARTPFLGGRQHPLSNSETRNWESTPKVPTDVQFQELSALVTAHSADLSTLRAPGGLLALRRILEFFHQLWKIQLRDEQKEEAERTQTYRYRGSFEDDEEVDEAELRTLFPTYEDVAEGERNDLRMDLKSVSLKIARLHAAIFEPGDAQTRVRTLITDSTRLLGSVGSKNKSSPTALPPKAHLSGLILALEDDMKKYGQVPPRSYNFYTDTNISEAKKLVSMVLSVQSRFKQLQASWPEHAAIHDVLICCQEILQFKHVEPVAKFLTKVEKLHALVHEWQLVASKEYSAVSVYEGLTALIINWRRLELSTWAKLLDIENEKCEEDVSSWWFIAYEVLLAGPLQMVESGEDITSYTKETVSTLEGFFRSTTMGQFRPRLRLVEYFKLLLLLYAKEFPALNSLVAALDNFLQHYQLFEPAISKSLEEGRKSLEKEIKQQIQLASWKDTNIAALRESARRSHYKLFKYVRKYRERLAQPTETILQQGIPDSPEVVHPATNGIPSESSSAPAEALAMCQQHDKTWNSRAPRFRDPAATAMNMFRVYDSSLTTEFDVPSQLDTFVTDVIESINDFKSQTPKVLTEENKETVQHLKTQKRRFYADTLRRLHLMGVRRNVSAVLQEEQASISQVLATSSSILGDSVSASAKAKSADSYFHRFLDLLPRVRQAWRDYSEDLNPVEATRSAGSAEGLLLLIRKQRDVISPALRDAATLRSTSLRTRNLWTSGVQFLCQEQAPRTEEKSDMLRNVAWLAPIVGVGIEIIEIHSKFSATDSSSIIQDLKTWKDRLYHLKETLSGLPELPLGICSQAETDAMKNTVDSLRQLSADAAKWEGQRPDLSFVLEQITSWADFQVSTTSATTKMDRELTLDDMNDEVLSTVDKILVALQGVKSSLSALPSSVEDKDWLAQTDSVLTKALKELHISEIAMSFDSVLSKLQFLQNGHGSDLSLASAIITSLLPVVEQHQAICEDLIGRFLSVHREISKMSYVLAKSFTQVASEGFCSPHEESNEENQAGKMESGTGLGEGEGAEDISKDVQDDEDLTDLAQQENSEQSKEDMEKSGDAVDMDQEDLQGEFDKEGDDKEENENESGSEGEEDEIDDEVGSVDSLDPAALDEKLWDGSHNEEQKETENEEGKGVSESDQQAASNDKKKGEGEGGEEQGDEEEEEEDPEDEGEAVGREEMDVTDPHAKEEETLDLPEEMQLDGDEKEDAGSDMDDGMDDLSDLGPEEEQPEQGHDETMDDEPAPQSEDVNMEENEEGDSAEAEDGQEAEKAEEDEEDEPVDDDEAEQQDIVRTVRDDNDADGNDVAQSEAVSGGLGVEQDTNEEKGTSGDTHQQGGSKDAEAQLEQQNGATEDGQDRQKAEDTPGGTGEQEQEDPQSQAFKKLGDVLEQWHRRQKEIMNSSQDADSQALPPDTDMADADFEHLADEDDVADTQALGQASEEQAKALDQKKAVESEATGADNEHLPDVSEDNKDPLANEKTLEDDVQMNQDTAEMNAQAGTSFTGNSTHIGELYKEDNGLPQTDETVDEVDTHLAAIHLSSSLAPLTSPEEARKLWSHYESVTNDLSLSLTEQLRLILAPTLATKLRGDFRTGKRLNIKRIIPYIASQYKRDKIWMRRSIPSKRNYQVMLAVDDSKSMMESGSGQLAFETLALVARSLNMLEVGDLCIVGFGDEEHVRVAHEFGKPFSSEAGVQVFQQFSYQQTGTNVRKLVADSIALFREARSRRSPAGGNATADLWQLQLIISDGICEDHDTIRRLVRQAQEERIMIVFIILDAVKGSSIVDLTQASFEPDLTDSTGTGEMKLKMKRYLEGFPFAYYLVVRDVRELPAVLAMALKQWFAEVVEVSS
jgi:midasin